MFFFRKCLATILYIFIGTAVLLALVLCILGTPWNQRNDLQDRKCIFIVDWVCAKYHAVLSVRMRLPWLPNSSLPLPRQVDLISCVKPSAEQVKTMSICLSNSVSKAWIKSRGQWQLFLPSHLSDTACILSHQNDIRTY